MQSLKSQETDGFVQVRDGKFILNGNPFFFTGSNFYRIALSDAFNKSVTKIRGQDGLNQYPQIDKVMENYSGENVRVIRLWGFSCENSRGTNLSPPIIYRDMNYSFDALEQLDYTIAAAGRWGLKVILTMVNYEPEYCGMEWWVENSLNRAGAEGQKRALYSCSPNDPKNHTVYSLTRDPGECRKAGQTPLPTRELFYTDDVVKQSYKKHLAAMLNRTNRYNGKVYKNDPGIFSIEVANEPHTTDYYECLVSNIGGKTSSQCRNENPKNYDAGKIVHDWLNEITAYVKSIDNNHLVSSGEEGYRVGHDDASCLDRHGWIHDGSKGVDFARDATIPTLDFMTTHLYPDNWAVPPSDLSWFDRCVIKDRAQIARNNNKPIIMEETGFDENIVAYKPQEYAKKRGQYIARMFDYTTKAGFQGVMVWQAAPLTVGNAVSEKDAFTFPIKTSNEDGSFDYSTEGSVVRRQADCMMNYSNNGWLGGDCFNESFFN